MAVKWSTPGIYQQEIDNTIQNNAASNSIGVGAIVMKSNKGPVNQRVLTTNYNKFTEIFGEPESDTDYGHFAAENYLANSNDLLCVRATMGDEGYAQIQFPYTDSDARSTLISEDIASFKYVNNVGDNYLDLIVPLQTKIQIDGYTSGAYKSDGPDGHNFYLKQTAQFGTIANLITDTASSIAIFKSVTQNDTPTVDDVAENIVKEEGKYITFANKVNNDGDVITEYDDLILTNDAWTSGSIPSGNLSITQASLKCQIGTSSVSGTKVLFTVPSDDTLNKANQQLTAYYNSDFIVRISTAAEIPYQELFNPNNFYTGKYSATSSYCADPIDAAKVEFLDWDDCTTKTHYVEKEAFLNSVGQTVGIEYKEFGLADYFEDLAMVAGDFAPSLKPVSACSFEELNKLAVDYGAEVADISNEKYGVLTYNQVKYGYNDSDEEYKAELVNHTIVKVVTVNDGRINDINDRKLDGTLNVKMHENLFWMTLKQNDDNPKTIAVYKASNPSPVIIPWQDGMKNNEENPVFRNKMVAFPTSEVLNGTDETYRDGYTVSIESDDEPGNGDIERYESVFDNQLIIASIGPGEYGNDIGISIITPECADIASLNNQNAFSWKKRYDDEDLVDLDGDDLTWKKVYRINVYVKSKSQTAESAWGFGMDALCKDPVESWFVSNDPTVKDNEGNSMFAPNVINGKSDYIYVSRASVNEARTGAGTYAMPRQTFAIYGLTGGTNSKKNTMVEKTAALKLYADKQKANFDILFNVDAVDTFNGRERFAAHQRRIAEIAASRTMDIGVVQVTSKEAKTVKRMLSEGKMFSFNNGTYVAAYAGYDKYYNSKLASWIYLPKSVAGACAMAYCDTFSYPWMAPAGYSRGGISYASGQLTRLNDSEIGQLYDNNINTSRQCGGFGELLWGQKTGLKKESALNRINVRRCMNFIEKQLEYMMTPYLYEQNTPNTRASARNSIDAFLSRVKAADGIIRYSLSVTQDSQDPHVMNVNIMLVPAEAIEAIFIKYNISRDSGISVEEETA